MAQCKRTLTICFLAVLSTLCIGGVLSSKKVIELNEGNWRLMLANEWMVEFYAPWCPACKGLEPIWKDFATWSDDIGITVAKVDVTTSPGLSGRFMVTALPTIFHVRDGEFRQYKGSRDKDSLISFVEEKKWKSVQPISCWQSPDSIQMTVVSTFFRLSQLLRQTHNTLMEEYGLPSWGSYLIFSISTIILGAVLGLILVCLIDLLFPQKSGKGGSAQTVKDKDSDNELADEDIKDDLLDDASQTEEAEDSENNMEEEKVEEEEHHREAEEPETNSPSVKKRRPAFNNF